METQPDVQEYGRVFSWTLILACNIIGILVWIVCTTDVTMMAIVDRLLPYVASAYSWTFQIVSEGLKIVIECVASCL